MSDNNLKPSYESLGANAYKQTKCVGPFDPDEDEDSVTPMSDYEIDLDLQLDLTNSAYDVDLSNFHKYGDSESDDTPRKIVAVDDSQKFSMLQSRKKQKRKRKKRNFMKLRYIEDRGKQLVSGKSTVKSSTPSRDSNKNASLAMMSASEQDPYSDHDMSIDEEYVDSDSDDTPRKIVAVDDSQKFSSRKKQKKKRKKPYDIKLRYTKDRGKQPVSGKSTVKSSTPSRDSNKNASLAMMSASEQDPYSDHDMSIDEEYVDSESDDTPRKIVAVDDSQKFSSRKKQKRKRKKPYDIKLRYTEDRGKQLVSGKSTVKSSTPSRDSNKNESLAMMSPSDQDVYSDHYMSIDEEYSDSESDDTPRKIVVVDDSQKFSDLLDSNATTELPDYISPTEDNDSPLVISDDSDTDYVIKETEKSGRLPKLEKDYVETDKFKDSRKKQKRKRKKRNDIKLRYIEDRGKQLVSGKSTVKSSTPRRDSNKSRKKQKMNGMKPHDIKLRYTKDRGKQLVSGKSTVKSLTPSRVSNKNESLAMMSASEQDIYSHHDMSIDKEYGDFQSDDTPRNFTEVEDSQTFIDVRASRVTAVLPDYESPTEDVESATSMSDNDIDLDLMDSANHAQFINVHKYGDSESEDTPENIAALGDSDNMVDVRASRVTAVLPDYESPTEDVESATSMSDNDIDLDLMDSANHAQLTNVHKCGNSDATAWNIAEVDDSQKRSNMLSCWDKEQDPRNHYMNSPHGFMQVCPWCEPTVIFRRLKDLTCHIEVEHNIPYTLPESAPLEVRPYSPTKPAHEDPSPKPTDLQHQQKPRLNPHKHVVVEARSFLLSGGMPLFPPACRDWSSHTIQLPLAGPLKSWPPEGWQEMSPDSRHLRLETVATTMSLMWGIPIQREFILDTFNFMTLPGGGHSRVTSESRKRNGQLAILSKIALGDKVLHYSSLLQMFQDAASTSHSGNHDGYNTLLQQCQHVPLRI